MKCTLKGLSTFQLWVSSLLLFVGSTAVLTLVDFFGVEWFDVAWQLGPDMFPNTALGYSLILMHLIAGGTLVAAGVRTYYARKSFKGIFYGFVLVLLTTIICLFLFFIFVYWYHVDLMGRPL